MTMAHLLERAATRWPQTTAFIDGDRSVSFEQAHCRSQALAAWLEAHGGQPGDRVGLFTHNCFEAFETMFATWAAGMAIVPANCRLQVEELAHIYKDSGVKFLVYSEPFRDKAFQLKALCPEVETWICVGVPGDDPGYEGIVAEETAFVAKPVDAGELAWIFYTSGTTGKPKGAMLSHRNLMAMVGQIQLEMNPARPGDVVLHGAPITHGSGLCAFNNLAYGATNAVIAEQGSFEPDKVFALIEKHRVTTMFLVPTMVRRLVGSPQVSAYDLSSLHTIIYGGAPMPLSHMTQAVQVFGPVFVQLFGQAEAPMACTVLPKDAHFAEPDADQLRLMSSAGREILGAEIAIFDGDGKRLGTCEHGEICVRGDIVMMGYWNNAQATADAIRSGWLHTGDAGHIDEQGYLFITDRIKDMIITGGANVYPREVEDAVCLHPAILEAAVVGIPDDEWGEQVVAFVAPKQDAVLLAEDVIEHCKALMADYKRPRRIEIRPNLPKSGYGKILRRELRDDLLRSMKRAD